MIRTWPAIALCACLHAACGPTAGTGDDDDDGVDGSPAVDADNDGYPDDVDCNDMDASVNPAAFEDCDDGIDNNCNGLADTDLICIDPCAAAEAQESYFGCEL